MEYYDMRNLLILTVIHNESYTKKQAKRRVLVHLTGQLIKYRYEDQLLTIKGVEDFLKGVEFLYKTNYKNSNDSDLFDAFVIKETIRNEIDYITLSANYTIDENGIFLYELYDVYGEAIEDN